MIHFLKKTLFNLVSLENYLRILQRSYFVLYRLGILKYDRVYDYHYFVKRLIKKGDVILDLGANMGYYSFLFARWTGQNGRVYAVEPVQIYNKVFNEMAKKYKNIALYSCALGMENKKVSIVNSPPPSNIIP